MMMEVRGVFLVVTEDGGGGVYRCFFGGLVGGECFGCGGGGGVYVCRFVGSGAGGGACFCFLIDDVLFYWGR